MLKARQSQNHFSSRHFFQEVNKKIEYQVDTCTIDSELYEKIDLVKIDVELHEFEVLQGMKKIIKSQPNNVTESQKPINQIHKWKLSLIAFLQINSEVQNSFNLIMYESYI